jgi:hypothetical protein
MNTNGLLSAGLNLSVGDTEFFEFEFECQRNRELFVNE